MTDSQIELLRQAHARLIVLPDPACQHLAGALDAFLSGKVDSLDTALGMKRSHGEHSALTKWARGQRNHCLRQALAFVQTPDEIKTDADRARVIEAAEKIRSTAEACR
jgi:hypothetical protein